MSRTTSMPSQLKSLAKSFIITLILAIFLIAILSLFIPHELLIFIQESKEYRVTELLIVALILLILGMKIFFRIKESTPKQETFIERK